VLDDICRVFAIAPACAVRTGFYRPNLTLLASDVSAGARDDTLLGLLRERPAGPTIVYVTQQRTAEELAGRLAAAGWPARPYHAGMPDEARSATQEWFMGADDAVVVATIAFGMGVDKADIRYVYHYNPPKSLENYAQEIGRAGRDGQPSVCHLLFCPDDLHVLENFIYGDTPDAAALRRLVGELCAGEPQFDVAQHELSARHDIRPLVLRTLLTYLELDGWLAGGTPFYADYRFRPQLTSAAILARFEGERRAFLAGLFRQARKGRDWFSLDPALAATALGCDRERVVRALDWLGEQGLLEVKVAGVRHPYRRLRSSDDPDGLAASLHERLLAREAAEVARLRQVLDLVAGEGCRTAALAAHFGETLERPCGHCSGCLGDGPCRSERAAGAIPATLAAELPSLLAAAGDALASPRALARFLCGVSSPALSRAKLTGHRLFGCLERVPFARVVAWTDSALPPA
jgi:ATP-dependent DNA helicase RecQ